MKNIFSRRAAIALTMLFGLAAGAAHAGALTVVNSSVINFTGYNGQPLTVTGAENKGLWGYLYATSAGTFYATYLGQESSYIDKFVDLGGQLLESSGLGYTITESVSAAGIVNFTFRDNAGGGHTFSNGQAQTIPLGFAIMKGQTNSYGTFDYILGFNDSYTGDADYDDFVVGVRFVTAPVPEPETYAMLLAGLGLVGFSARRRNINT